ncbi:MAG: hypothetical protein WC829_08820 [Hyphomicrobium sp.]|jgi:hypothetical protein
MPTTQPRYGRPKGTGLDDSRQLESIAALLAANPGLKPTTAIRSLGVEDPSAIRRLRDKFRIDQARLMANARHSFRSNGRALANLSPSRPAQRRQLASVRTFSPPAAITTPAAASGTIISVETAHVAPQQQVPLLATWSDFGLRAMTIAIEQQAVLAQHWLQLPAVEMALRGQLAVGAFLVAVATPRKPLKPRIH